MDRYVGTLLSGGRRDEKVEVVHKEAVVDVIECLGEALLSLGARPLDLIPRQRRLLFNADVRVVLPVRL